MIRTVDPIGQRSLPPDRTRLGPVFAFPGTARQPAQKEVRTLSRERGKEGKVGMNPGGLVLAGANQL